MNHIRLDNANSSILDNISAKYEWLEWRAVYPNTVDTEALAFAHVAVLRGSSGDALESSRTGPWNLFVYYDPPEGKLLYIQGRNPSVEETLCITGGYLDEYGERTMGPGDSSIHDPGLLHDGYGMPNTLLYVRFEGDVDTISAMRIVDQRDLKKSVA